MKTNATTKNHAAPDDQVVATLFAACQGDDATCALCGRTGTAIDVRPLLGDGSQARPTRHVCTRCVAAIRSADDAAPVWLGE